MSTAGRPLRRDAELNRERLMAAARELFAERGLAVTLDEIARHAGLGVGTAYRRFGSRDALVDALFEETLREIVALADEALEVPDPWEGFVGFVERLVAQMAADRGLKEVILGTPEGSERVRRIRDEMWPRGAELVRRAQASGELRADFDASDLPLLQLMVGAVADVTMPERPHVPRRMLAFLIDGLRAGASAGEPVSDPPVGFEDLDQVMVRWRPARRPPPPRAPRDA